MKALDTAAHEYKASNSNPRITQSSDADGLMIYQQQKITFTEELGGNILLPEDAQVSLCSEAFRQGLRRNAVSFLKQKLASKAKNARLFSPLRFLHQQSLSIGLV